MLRNGQTHQFAITPKEQNDRGFLGINSQTLVVMKKYGIAESILRGVQRCWELTLMTFDLLRRLVTLQASAKTVGGPIMIAQMSGEVARQDFLSY